MGKNMKDKFCTIKKNFILIKSLYLLKDMFFKKVITLYKVMIFKLFRYMKIWLVSKN